MIEIDSEACNGCGDCAEVCQEIGCNAIHMRWIDNVTSRIAWIITALCHDGEVPEKGVVVRCSACVNACQEDAIITS